MSWLPIPRPMTAASLKKEMAASDHLMKVLDWLWPNVALTDIAELLADLDTPQTRERVTADPVGFLAAHNVVAAPGTTIAITEPAAGFWRIEATGARNSRVYHSGFDSNAGFFMRYTRLPA